MSILLLLLQKAILCVCGGVLSPCDFFFSFSLVFSTFPITCLDVFFLAFILLGSNILQKYINCQYKGSFQSFTLDIAPALIGEGNGNPLQYSCLENPVDRGAW